MRVAIGADHAGFELKRDLAGYVAQQGHEVTDLGTHSTAPVDYPDTAEAVATAVRNGQADRGILDLRQRSRGRRRRLEVPRDPRRRLPRHLHRPPGRRAR